MRTNLNLSSKPFTNHRLLWIAVAVVFFLSLWMGLWVNSETAQVRAEADRISSQIKLREQEVKAFKEEQERLKKTQEQIVMGEQDAIQLASARDLIASKGFSWSKLISDIERFVPNKAKVTSIQVAGASSAGGIVAAQVELKAIGQTAGLLTETMEALEKSDGLFEVGSFSQEPADETNEVPFTIRVTYLPSRGER